MTTAWWDFKRDRGDHPLLSVHLVTGGHPDRWVPLLADWRATPPPPQQVPPPAPGSTRRSRQPDHRWLESVIGYLTADLVPTVPSAGVPQDGTLRGTIRQTRDIVDHEWHYSVVSYPASVVITHVPTQNVVHDFTRRAIALGVLKANAEAAGDLEEVDRLAAEEMLDGLTGK